MRLRTVGPVASKTKTFKTVTFVRNRRVLVQLIAAATVALGLSACGTETATEYSAENQEAFMAACVDGPIDGVYQQRVCRCVYEEAQDTIPFERFLEINEELADVENSVLPEDLLDVIAGCVIEEGDL